MDDEIGLHLGADIGVDAKRPVGNVIAALGDAALETATRIADQQDALRALDRQGQRFPVNGRVLDAFRNGHGACRDRIALAGQ